MLTHISKYPSPGSFIFIGPFALNEPFFSLLPFFLLFRGIFPPGFTYKLDYRKWLWFYHRPNEIFVRQMRRIPMNGIQRIVCVFAANKKKNCRRLNGENHKFSIQLNRRVCANKLLSKYLAIFFFSATFLFTSSPNPIPIPFICSCKVSHLFFPYSLFTVQFSSLGNHFSICASCLSQTSVTGIYLVFHFSQKVKKKTLFSNAFCTPRPTGVSLCETQFLHQCILQFSNEVLLHL